ncbi:ATP-binding protein, partial [bacterium]|nr:ATP-binding protein [bacterium]
MPLNISSTRDHLQEFDFRKLFIEDLGWSQPSNIQPIAEEINDYVYERKQIAQLSGVVVFEIHSLSGSITDKVGLAAVHKEISFQHHENLLIFTDKDRTQSLWYYVKREDGKKYPREHLYMKGQPGDLFLSKLSSMVVEISELDEKGNISVVEVAQRLRSALDVECVTKKFYKEFQQEHIAFIDFIEGIKSDTDLRWYASIMLNRLMFIYFLQRKGFLNNGDSSYLQNKLKESRVHGKNRYYEYFLKPLFFTGFAKPEKERTKDQRALLGPIPYLNGGLFLVHSIEERWPSIRIPDHAFDNLFALFQRYSWNLDDTPGGEDDEINPDVLGYIFEKYINQKAFGAYYTRSEITEYLCERTIHQLVVDRINTTLEPGRFDSIADVLINLDTRLCRELVRMLPEISILDPACGSGAFLVAAMKTLINIYSAVVGKIRFLGDVNLKKWLTDIERDHKSIAYFIKKKIVTENI